MRVEQELQYQGDRLKRRVYNSVGKAMLAFALLTASGAAIAADTPQHETYLPYLMNNSEEAPPTPSPTLTSTPTETSTPIPTPTVTPTPEPTPTATAIPPEFGMTVPWQTSDVKQVAELYPDFPYLSDWTNGEYYNGGTTIIGGEKCSLPNFIPMIYVPEVPEPSETCKDGRILILGNECGVPGQCNSTIDEEFAMWEQYRDWPGPVVLCNQLSWYGGTTRCETLLERYQNTYGSFPPDTYLGLHTYAAYQETNVPDILSLELYEPVISAYYDLSEKYGLKRFIGEWGFYGNPSPEMERRVLQDMHQITDRIIAAYKPEIMMYFTLREEHNIPFSQGNLLGPDGNLTPIGEAWFEHYYSPQSSDNQGAIP